MMKDNVFLGFTDEELKKKISLDRINKGMSPWLYWTSELYSFGRLYREDTYFPKFLPLCIYSDHGIHRSSELSSHEKENKSNVHFTFNPERANKSTVEGKEVLLVMHPWIKYRRKKNYKPLDSAKGTLVFISHSTVNTEYIDEDRDKYFLDLKNLSEKYKPLVLCMHMNDIKNNNHLQYKKYNLPIITIGNPNSVEFVDEFYKTTTQFKYATSNSAGSQLYYCVEMGMPYFIFGEKPRLMNHSDSNLPYGIYNPTNDIEKEIIEIENKLFKNLEDRISLEQKIFVEWMLGFGSNQSRYNMTLIIWRELFRNISYIANSVRKKSFTSKEKEK